MILIYIFFFFNDTATTEIYTLSLHDALPISLRDDDHLDDLAPLGPQADTLIRESRRAQLVVRHVGCRTHAPRSEEHTSELQSRQYLVCRLLLEKKKKNINRS